MTPGYPHQKIAASWRSHSYFGFEHLIRNFRYSFLCLTIIVLAAIPQALSFLNLRAGVMEESTRFLHRDHLRLPNVTCQSCHTLTRESLELADFLAPSSTLCAGCHDGQKTNKLKMPVTFSSGHGLPTKLRFSHKQHLALGNVAPAIQAAVESNQYLGPVDGLKESLSSANECLACHRGLSEIDEKNSAHYPQMADCLVCHATIEPPFSCELCHPSDAKLKPATHNTDFMDTHSSQIATLDRSTCKVCHGVKFRCKGCH